MTSLPVLNSSPKYDVLIPSIGKKVKFRPYLVKEEKVLLLAMESKDESQILSAVADTVVACLSEEINRASLTTFDVEYMFLKIRSKSVGESSHLNLRCSECEEYNEYTLNLEEIKMGEVPKVEKIKIDDNIWVQMKWPSYTAIAEDTRITDAKTDTERAFEILVHSMDSILTEENKFKISESPRDEVIRFIESMNSNQYRMLTEWISKMPKLTHTIEFTCKKCDHQNSMDLDGIYDFF